MSDGVIVVVIVNFLNQKRQWGFAIIGRRTCLQKVLLVPILSMRFSTLWPFAFALLFAVGLAFLVHDVRYARVSEDTCLITSTGETAHQQKNASRVLYQQSESVSNDISLQCPRFGRLWLNDSQFRITPVQAGQQVLLKFKRYHFLPQRWQLSVR